MKGTTAINTCLRIRSPLRITESGNLMKKKRLFSYARKLGAVLCEDPLPIPVPGTQRTRQQGTECAPTIQPLSRSVWGSPGNLAAISTICKPQAVNFHIPIKLFYGHITWHRVGVQSQANVQHADIKGLWVFQIRCYLKLGLNGFPENAFVVKLGLEIWYLDA